MLSILQGVEEKDQRSTMLQLIDKMKMMQKNLGWLFCSVLYLIVLLAAGGMRYLTYWRTALYLLVADAGFSNFG